MQKIHSTRIHLMFIKFLMFVFLLTGCLQKENIATELPNALQNITPVTQANNECISPLVETFAYPSATDPNKPTPGKTFHVFPTLWQHEKDFPRTSQADVQPPTLVLTRKKDAYIELWFSSKPIPLYREHNINLYQFWVYFPDKKSWKSVPARVNNSNVVVDKLFVTQSGDIWGQNFWDTRTKIENQPIFSKYNEKTNSFTLVQGIEKIPAARKDSSEPPFWSEVLLDKNDVFWVFAHKDAIYSYSIQAKEIRTQAKIPDIIVSYPVIRKNGSILFLNPLDQGVSNSDHKLYVFSPESGKVGLSYTMLEPWPLYTNIFIDHSGRTWFGSVGWYEPDGRWFIINRPEIFITNSIYSGTEYRWRTPFIVGESSDGRLWFRSDNGMAWLDPQKEQWCWFTTYQSNIVEDSEHNLWMIADGKLYKLPLGEK